MIKFHQRVAQVPVSDNLPTGPTVATLLDPVEAGGGMDLEEPAAALGGPCEWECPGPCVCPVAP